MDMHCTDTASRNLKASGDIEKGRSIKVSAPAVLNAFLVNVGLLGDITGLGLLLAVLGSWAI